MKKSIFTSLIRAARRLTRRGRRLQSGQALVVLAIGFIGLLGFVGIVTDVSLLFIRYSTMRRAVDAASVAAAGQMRRIADSNPSDAIAQDEADSVARLNLAARQFIELYGLNPTNVLVETCRAQRVNRDSSGNALDRTGVPLILSSGAPNPAANEEDIRRYRQLCTEDELKLVRVTAQIEAPTVFMRLLGYDTVTLTESAISQTAVLDVILILDVSESMLNETRYSDWDTLSPPRGVRYMPPYVDPDLDDPRAADPLETPPIPYDRDAWLTILNSTQADLTNALHPLIPYTEPPEGRRYQINDTIVAFEPNGSGGWQEYTGSAGSPIGRVEPRPLCQVRSLPISVYPGHSPVPAWLRQEYAGYFGANYGAQFMRPGLSPAQEVDFRGFVPQYNYFACCNDPDGALDAFGNFDMSDSVCQPFRQARDAAEGFLARLDFLRGDRVGIVTFGRAATVLAPRVRNAAGENIQGVMFESEIGIFDGTTRLRWGALEFLRQAVGVRSENASYGDLNGPDGQPDGFWDRVMDGATPRTYDGLMNLRVDDFVDHPALGSCPYDKAFVGPTFSLARTMPDGSSRGNALLEDIYTVPFWAPPIVPPGVALRGQSYEFRASCAGTNTGGGLARASDLLYGSGRREGAVWIMVMLSDGSANGSDTMTRNGEQPLQPNPYNIDSGFNRPINALGGEMAITAWPPPPTVYGAFGLCPYGTPDNPGELLRDDLPPYCQDLLPETRTLCGTTAQPPTRIYLDAYPNCYEFYDVEDYARDWADWIGLAELPGVTLGGGSGRVSNQLLPTIFTIGFGLNFDADDGSPCAGNPNCMRGFPPARPTTRIIGGQTVTTRTQMRWREDYLGEELLRYIADVGDNFQVDDDYWQRQMGARIINGFTGDVTTTDWGPRGACEDPFVVGDIGTVYQPLPPATSCGNYFAAQGGAELVIVFNEIASRMFTRLSQ
jgi:Flp pilus assembly protein TadG